MAPRKGEKEKNQHIQVVVRLRPLNSTEKRQGSYNAVDYDTDKKEITVKDKTISTAPTKSFTFDRVFGPHAEQIELYKLTVVPIIEEVLLGYNCTIFAYGQTGTGKTFTMEGEKTEEAGITWENDPLSGIIPRSMSQIFSRLETMDVEYSVRVSFLEIYNEELIDLLGAESVENPRLKIYEDAAKKGSCVIQGLEDVVINNRQDVYSVLEKGSQRRQTAATLMNAHSSRSHSVFTVTIHMKENSIDGEELLKTGKLNLVDLAGSECVGRSGAIDKRAREAGNINQSLLTLGRVITALVEHAPHVPYRESKLTRLLQDSLGGRTKTSIIATVSPASCNLDETLSTLDYAHRAKNITNKPEINQKLTKKAMLKEYTEEIERLRRDLQAARDKNGIYIAQENYDVMQNTLLQQKDSIKEFEDKIELMMSEMNKLMELFTFTKEELEDTNKQLEKTSKTLEVTENTLVKTKGLLRDTRQQRDEQKHLVLQHVKTETKLHGQASQLLYTADESTHDVSGLHAKLDRKKAVESHNLSAQETFTQTFRENISRMQTNLAAYADCQQKNMSLISQDMGGLVEKRSSEIKELSDDISGLLVMVQSQAKALHQSQENFSGNWTKWANKLISFTKASQETEVCRQNNFHQETFISLMSAVQASLRTFDSSLNELSEKLEKQRSENELCLQQFVNQQIADLDHQRELMTTYVKEHTESLNKHAQDTANLHTSQEQLDKNNIDNFLEIVGNAARELQKKRSESVQAITQQISHDIRASCKSAESFSLSVFSNIEESRKKVEADNKHIQNQYTINCQESSQVITSLRTDSLSLTQNTSKLQSNTDSFSARTTEICGSTCDEIVQRVEHQVAAFDSQLSAHKSATQSLCVDCTGSFKDLENSQTMQHAELTSAIKSQQSLLSKFCKDVTDWQEKQHTEVEERNSDIIKFLSEEMKKDVPTGKTPQRRPFTYPKSLAETAPHGTILEHFRKNYLMNEAVNTPLPDTSINTEASVVIPNFDLDAVDEDMIDDCIAASENDRQNMSGDSAISSVSITSSSDTLDKCESKENIMGPPQRSRNNMSNSLRHKASSLPVSSTLKTSTPTSDRPRSKTRLPLRSSNQ